MHSWGREKAVGERGDAWIPPVRQRGQGSGRDCPRRALLSPDRPRTRTDASGQGLDPRRTSLHRPRHLIAQLLLTRRLPTRGVFLLTLCQMWF